MRIDKGEYWEMIKEIAGATFMFFCLYILAILGFCL